MRLLCIQVLFVLSAILFISHAATLSTSFVSTTKGNLKILGIFGHLGKSHFDVFKNLLEELARRGHDVTVVSHYPRTDEAKLEEPLPNYKDISLRDEKVGLFLDVVDLSQAKDSIFQAILELHSLRFMASIACESGLRNPKMIELANSKEKFDIVLTESFNTDCFLAVVNKLNAPFVQMSSHQVMIWSNEQMGNPHSASYMPSVLMGTSRPMSFFQRLSNVLSIGIVAASYDTWFYQVDQALVEEVYGPDVPDLRQIARNASALMINTHYSLHGTRPLLPNLIEVGGLHIPSKTNPLPKDIAEFLDNAKEGVLYFNLGSMVKASSMPKKKLEVILKVFNSIPRKVLWKWEADTLPYKLDNVLMRKWLPQFDILNHPNVKCYFGHGGLLGVSEGVYVGVPMILMPIYGDQFHNSAAVAGRGAGIVLKFADFNEKSLRHAIDEGFNNTRYRENARKLSKAYRDRPASPLETAVWWTEYIARGNGFPYLKSEGANLPWYQRHLLDVALFLLAFSLAFLYVIYRLLAFLLRLVLSFVGVGTKRKEAHAVRDESKKRE